MSKMLYLERFSLIFDAQRTVSNDERHFQKGGLHKWKGGPYASRILSKSPILMASVGIDDNMSVF